MNRYSFEPEGWDDDPDEDVEIDDDDDVDGILEFDHAVSQNLDSISAQLDRELLPAERKAAWLESYDRAMNGLVVEPKDVEESISRHWQERGDETGLGPDLDNREQRRGFMAEIIEEAWQDEADTNPEEPEE
jgi:hypothetical protein